MVAVIVRLLATVPELGDDESVPIAIVEAPNVPDASDNCAVKVLPEPNVPVVENGTEMVFPAQVADGDRVLTVMVWASPVSDIPRPQSTEKSKE
jgi:hypothetical protein